MALWGGGIWGGSGGSGSDAYPTVNTYADLPDPTTVPGDIYVVLTATGLWPFNRKPAGMYRSDGAAWSYMSAYPDIFKDGNFGIQNTADGTKVMNVDVSPVATGTTRTLSMANRNYDLDKPSVTYLDAIVGGANPTYAEGRVFYDNTKKALSYYNNESDVTINIGQEIIIPVRNESGATIPNGAAVYPISVSGGLPTIGLATAHDKEKCRLVGIATHDIENNSNGYVTKFGSVGGLDTSGYAATDIVYLSDTPGALTATRPTGSSYITQVGKVGTIDATNGNIVVDISITEFSVEASSVVGWSPTDTATIAFVDGTRTLTISPTGTDFCFYQFGDKYCKATDSIQIDDTEGMWVIYYSLGTLQKLLNPTDAQVSSLIRANPLVAYVYWNATDNKAEYIGNELHEIGMSADTHNYAHFSFGARYLSGLLPTDVLADESGGSNSHAQFGMSSGAIADEDNYFPTNTIASTVGLPIAYLAGAEATPTLRFTTNAGYSILTTGTGRMAYNAVSGGNWSLLESVNLDYVCCHVLAINENNISKRVVAFVGQANYATSADARTGAATELRDLKRAGILPQETVQLATFIFQTADAYTNAVNARVISIDSTNDWIDWTGGAVSSPGSSTVQSTFSDADFAVFDDGDITKIGKFQLSGNTTGTTRTITWPDRNLDLNAPTFTGAIISPLVVTNPIFDFPANNAYRLIGDGTNDTATAFDAILTLAANGDTYKQLNIFNASSGSSASSDYVATANNGTDTTHYINMGINSGSFSAGGGTLGAGANVGYLLCIDDELHIFTGAAQALRLGVNNTEYLTIGSTGLVGVGTNAPSSTFEMQGGLTTVGSVLTLGTKETTVDANDVLGRINFYAPLEASGGDALLPGASIAAIAEASFTSTVNTTSLAFQTGDSETALTRMRITGAGRVAINRSVNTATQLWVEATASGVNESIQRWSVSDDAGSYLEARNGLASTSASRFNPCLYGLSSNTSDPCVTIWGGLPGQTGTTPAVRIKADYNGAVTTTRPVLTITNYTTDLARFLADGVFEIVGDTLRISTQKTPATAGAAGTKGDIVHDANYIYVCTATNTWKRAAIATW